MVNPMLSTDSPKQAYRKAGPEKLPQGLSKDCRFERESEPSRGESSDWPVLIFQEALRNTMFQWLEQSIENIG